MKDTDIKGRYIGKGKVGYPFDHVLEDWSIVINCSSSASLTPCVILPSSTMFLIDLLA